jgi:hypothetical protein
LVYFNQYLTTIAEDALQVCTTERAANLTFGSTPLLTEKVMDRNLRQPELSNHYGQSSNWFHYKYVSLYGFSESLSKNPSGIIEVHVYKREYLTKIVNAENPKLSNPRPEPPKLGTFCSPAVPPPTPTPPPFHSTKLYITPDSPKLALYIFFLAKKNLVTVGGQL